jgi:RNA polymerase sigma-70 factor (ECF subfamily)
MTILINTLNILHDIELYLTNYTYIMEMRKMNDAELISQYKKGRESAFSELLSRYSTKVYTSILLIVKDRYKAEDLMQECFMKAIDRIKSGVYNEEGKFGPWISRMAHNMAIDHFRKQKRNPTVILEDGSPVFNTMEFTEESIESVHVAKETSSRLKELIGELPENQREVLVMRHFSGLSFQEIAEETGVSINTALGRMRYALINLRKKINQKDFAYD